MKYTRNEDKNILLKRERNIRFEHVVRLIQSGLPHKDETNDTNGYEHQGMIIILIDGYPYKIPYVQIGDVRHLVTIYQARKYKNLFY